jgi:hypothetical protein
MSRPIGTAIELERRRKRAAQAVADGQPRATVAEVLGVHPKTIDRWVRLARHPGGLDAKPQSGPAPGLTDADLRRLEGLLAKGAKAHGWYNELWTASLGAGRSTPGRTTGKPRSPWEPDTLTSSRSCGRWEGSKAAHNPDITYTSREADEAKRVEARGREQLPQLPPAGRSSAGANCPTRG